MSFFEQQLAEIKKQTSLAVELINDKLVNDSESIKNIHSKKAILLSKVAAKMPQSLDVISKYNNTLISLKFLGEHLKRFQEQVTTWAQKLSDVIKEFLTEMESELSGTTQAILGTVKKAKNAPLLTKLLEKAQKIQSDGGDFLERLGGNHTEFEGIKSEDLTDYYYQCGSKGQSPIELCLSGHCYKRSSRRQGLFGFKLLKKIRKCHTNLFNSRLSVLITGLALH
eukprot:g4532.t1